MRRSVVGMGLLLAALTLAPRVARGDVIVFYGCAQGLPDACITLTFTGSPSAGYDGVPSTDFAFRYQTASGATFSLFDSFGWRLPDGTCVGGDTGPEFRPGSCAAQNAASMVITGQVRWAPAGANPLMPTESSLITFTATPEPTSVALAATGLLVIGGVGLARRRRSLM